MNSSLYRELSAKELHNVIANALHDELHSYRLLTGGLFNTTYLADTAEHGRVVLRIGPVNRHLLMPFEHDLMKAEQRVYALYKEHKIPASEILMLDTSKTFIDRDYMIVRYIPSKPMSVVELGLQDRKRICFDIGTVVAKMHKITKFFFGRVADVENGKGFLCWSDCLLAELKAWESAAMQTPLFLAEEYEQIHCLFEQVIPFLKEIHTPCLVHADLWFGNILIRNDSEHPEFAAIIDADRAIWADPDFEFSAIRWTHSEPAFWQGYGRELSVAAPDRIRRTFYALLGCLLDAYVFMREYNQPKNAYAMKAEAMIQMNELNTLLRSN